MGTSALSGINPKGEKHMTKKKLSRSLVALVLSAAMALTGCDTDDDDPDTTSPGDTTVTTIAELTTTTVGAETTTIAP
jgi:hypothetical protein